VLRTKCELVEKPASPAVRIVADDLRETLRDLRSRHGMGRGIAGPQIGAPVRIIHLDLDRPVVMINPEIVDVGPQDFPVWDDCFSFPDLMVRVLRADRVRVRFQDLRGRVQSMDAERDVAELLQHEIDHLDGVLAVDRASGLDPFCLREEWNKHYAGAGRYGPPAPREMVEASLHSP
jgi:peptide deformylase